MRHLDSKRVLWSVVLLLALLLVVGLAAASGEMLPRSLMSSGGGMVGQEGITLHSAIGQPLAGTVQNGETLCSGFLCGAGASPPSVPDDYVLYLPTTIR